MMGCRSGVDLVSIRRHSKILAKIPSERGVYSRFNEGTQGSGIGAAELHGPAER